MTTNQGWAPPKVEPQQLVNTLLTLPYPTKSIQFKLDSNPLAVKAISSFVYNQSLHRSKIDFICAAVMGHELLSNPRQAEEELLVSEVQELFEQTVYALTEISPIFGYIDHRRWSKVINEGLRHHSLYTVNEMLGGSYDIVGGSMLVRSIERPDRFFGVPTNQLLDGHLLVYREARIIAESKYK